ncbi:MAG: hypothetical protein U1D55_06345 [Phycisphaerae bacterium]
MFCAPGTAWAQQPARYAVSPDSNGAWSFVAPDGKRFLSIGVDNVSPSAWNPREGTRYYDAVRRQFNGDAKAWSDATRELLKSNGFNTLGAWSRSQVAAGEGLHRTIVLYVAAHAQDRCLSPLRPGFDAFVRENIRTTLAEYPDRGALLGVFLDNEMAWWGRSGWDIIPTYTLLERALELPVDDPARKAATDFLRAQYATPEAFARAWDVELKAWSDLTVDLLRASATPAALSDRAAFTTHVAHEFFSVAGRVTREELPGVLILGVRYAGSAPDGVLEEDAKCSDVISLNDYNFDPRSGFDHYARFWLKSKRPLMITEFSWRAKENSSGCSNTRGAGQVVTTQRERAERYEAFWRELATIPVIVGAHWFEFADQSPQGRFDGEDSNYGIVDIENRPYETLLNAMKRVHAEIPTLRSAKLRRMPEQLAPQQKPTYTPGQHPERPATLDLLADWTDEPELWGAADAKLTWRREGDELLLEYEAGVAYGAGINLRGPKSCAVHTGPAGATDLDGYAAFVIDLDAPRGVQLNLVLAEAGAGPLGQSEYGSAAGDDGEAYVSTPFFGRGARHEYRIAITDLERQRPWGNQSGRQRIDMQAIRNLGLQVQGRPERGTLHVYGLRLER